MSIERIYRWLVGGAVVVLVLGLVDWIVNDDSDAVWIGVAVIVLFGIATRSYRRYADGQRRAARLPTGSESSRSTECPPNDVVWH